MTAGDSFCTIAAPREAGFKERGSRFIARAFPVEDAEMAEARIEELRSAFHRATHHCTAYRVGPAGDVFRYNDDGEPSGTAGPPILNQIDQRELTNTLVVVTRHFGGTKLGTGGLVRAYGQAASDVLDRCQVVEKVIRQTVRLRFAYDDTGPAMQVLNQFDAEVAVSNYSERTELILRVRRSEVERLLQAFADALGGRGEATAE